MGWKCSTCGEEHGDLPLRFGNPAPALDIPPDEWDERVQLSDDQCIVDGKDFFVRGHIEIPIIGHPEAFAFSVWSSLSETSFDHMSERWEDPDRDTDPPYFGWLCSSLPLYPDTLLLKLSVQSRAPGLVPHFTLEPAEHPLSLDQHNGITVAKWHDMATQLLALK